MFVVKTQVGFLPTPTGPVIVTGEPVSTVVLTAISVGITLFKLFSDWLQRGELKIQATAKAEEFVRHFYGLEPGCTMPTPGIPIEPGGKHFCAESVAGMIERCELAKAHEFLAFLERNMREQSARDTYFARWVNQYGNADIIYLNGRISAAKTKCPGTVPIPTPIPAPLPGPTPLPTPTQMNIMPIIFLGGLGFVLLMFAKR